MAGSKNRSRAARRWAERILNDESLTADLVDDAAGALLDWGITQIDELAQQTTGLAREQQEERFAALRGRMKRAAREAGRAAPAAQQEQVLALLEKEQTRETNHRDTEDTEGKK